MGPTEINGIPAHALLVHLVVVVVPTAALALAAAACFPAARRRLGVATPGIALIALISIPMTTYSGEWLARRVPMNRLTAVHIGLADELLPWVAGMAVLSTLVWGRERWSERRPALRPENQTATETAPRARGLVATVVIAVLALSVSTGSVVQVYRIGDAGARAVWSGTTD